MENLGYYIAIWFACGVIAGSMGKNRNQNVLGFFMLGFLLGPLGVLIAFLIKPDAKATEDEALRNGQLIKCPACAESIKSEANICRYCQSDLGSQVWSLSINEGGVTNCPRCRGRVTLEPSDMESRAFECPICKRHVRFA